MKINFHKSELFFFGKEKDIEHQYKRTFGCEVGSLPFRYLGVPIHHKKLRNAEWNPVESFCCQAWMLAKQATLSWRNSSSY
jgi:hypothetical protein